MLVSQPSAALAQCNLSPLARHVNPERTRIYAASQGEPTIYFRSDVDVNTDGSSRSYHPADPRGRMLALNNMGNAISGIWDAQGRDIGCAPRSGPCFTRYMNTFIAARDSNWNTSGHPRIATGGMIPWRADPQLGRSAPCTIQTGPYRGHFVSQTSFIVDSSLGECEQARYLDSLVFQAAVLPKRVAWASMGQRAGVGDMVVVYAPATQRIAYGIIGDTGPADGLGEASVAMAAQLRDAAVLPNATYDEIKALAMGDAQYLVFSGRDIRAHISGALAQGRIDQEVQAIFNRWGGMTRLSQCAALPR